jgi:hypothetical protein
MITTTDPHGVENSTTQRDVTEVRGCRARNLLLPKLAQWGFW